MKIAIDLIWVKHNKMGGLESYVRNILDAFCNSLYDFKFIILLSIDNYDSFSQYRKDRRIELVKCNVKSESLINAIIWENLKMDRLVSKCCVDFCFVPYYRQPILRCKNKYLITIHDLIPLHFQDVFSKARIIWMKYYWGKAVELSHHIIAISEFQKKDILSHFHCNPNKISVLYNPIIVNQNILSDFSSLKNIYNIEKQSYFYTISSRYKHKNLETLLQMMKKMKDLEEFSGFKLIISGVNAGETDSLMNYIARMGLSEKCILTGFVTNDQRNCLIKNAYCFLFPSVFEGFGMPPIEAMKMGTKCITTKCASLPEVTQNRAIYVDNPYDADEWILRIKEIPHHRSPNYAFSEYDPSIVATNYFKLFSELISDVD